MLKKYDGAGFVSTPTYKKASSGLTTGLVSYYSFDTNANDDYGSNDGTVSGATHITGGKLGGCYSFDGSNDYISLGSTSALYPTNMSMSAWIYPTTTSGVQTIWQLGLLDGSADEYDRWFIYTNKLRINWQTSSANRHQYEGSTTLSPNQWYHVVITRAGTAEPKMYLNGVEETNTTITNSGTSTRCSIEEISISENATFGASFPGKIDEFGVWSKVLSATEVSELYNTSKAKKLETFDYDYADVKSYDGSNWNYINPIQYDEDLSNGLVSYYNFEENATDQVGSNDGTVSGATYTASGKVDGCYSFDGINDWIDLPAASANSTIFSVSCWFKRGTPSGEDMIITKWVHGGIGNTDRWGIGFIGGSTNLSVNIGNDSTWRTLGASTNTDWNHAVITYNGTTCKGYYNGIEILSFATSYTVQAVTKPTLGDFNAHGYGEYNGLIDEVCIWNRAISQAEVTKLYNNSNARYYK